MLVFLAEVVVAFPADEVVVVFDETAALATKPRGLMMHSQAFVKALGLKPEIKDKDCSL